MGPALATVPLWAWIAGGTVTWIAVGGTTTAIIVTQNNQTIKWNMEKLEKESERLQKVIDEMHNKIDSDASHEILTHPDATLVYTPELIRSIDKNANNLVKTFGKADIGLEIEDNFDSDEIKSENPQNPSDWSEIYIENSRIEQVLESNDPEVIKSELKSLLKEVRRSQYQKLVLEKAKEIKDEESKDFTGEKMLFESKSNETENEIKIKNKQILKLQKELDKKNEKLQEIENMFDKKLAETIDNMKNKIEKDIQQKMEQNMNKQMEQKIEELFQKFNSQDNQEESKTEPKSPTPPDNYLQNEKAYIAKPDLDPENSSLPLKYSKNSSFWSKTGVSINGESTFDTDE